MTPYELETLKRNIYHKQRGEFEFVVPLESEPESKPAYEYKPAPEPRKRMPWIVTLILQLVAIMFAVVMVVTGPGLVVLIIFLILRALDQKDRTLLNNRN